MMKYCFFALVILVTLGLKAQNLKVQNFDIDLLITNGLEDDKLGIIFYETSYQKENSEFIVLNKETFRLLARYDYPEEILKTYHTFDSLLNYYENLPDFNEVFINQKRGITPDGYLIYWLEFYKNGVWEISNLFKIDILKGTVVYSDSDVSYVDDSFRFYVKYLQNKSAKQWQVIDITTGKSSREFNGIFQSIKSFGSDDYIVNFQKNDQFFAYSTRLKKLLNTGNQANSIISVVKRQAQEGYISQSNFGKNTLQIHFYDEQFDVVSSSYTQLSGELTDHRFINDNQQSLVITNESEGSGQKLIIDNNSGKVLFDLKREEKTIGNLIGEDSLRFSIKNDKLFTFPSQPLVIIKENEKIAIINYLTKEQFLVTNPALGNCHTKEVITDNQLLHFTCPEMIVSVDISAFKTTTEKIPYFLQHKKPEEIINILIHRGSLDFSDIPNAYNSNYVKCETGILTFDPVNFQWEMYDLQSSKLKFKWLGKIKQTSATIHDIFFGDNQILNILADDIWIQYDFEDANKPLKFLNERLRHITDPGLKTNYFRTDKYLVRKLTRTKVDYNSPDHDEITSVITYKYAVSDQKLADSSVAELPSEKEIVPKNEKLASIANDRIIVYNKGDHLQITNKQTGLTVDMYLFDRSLYNVKNLTGLSLPSKKITNIDYVIICKDGFDFNHIDATKRLHFARDFEIIDFTQLKDRYWVPGLLQRVVKGEPIPEKNSRDIKDIDLYPKIRLKHPMNNKGVLGIQLYDQGGGYGSVRIWVNGKEVSSDIRGSDFDHSLDSITLSYDITGHPFLKNEELNTIEVSAFNSEDYVMSRPKKLYYIPKGSREAYEPVLHAIIVGTSDYIGNNLDLGFPAKDARAFSSALELSAKNLLGIGKTNFRLLTTDDKNWWPSKENIRKAYAEIAKTAKPYDVIVLYFAGHGVNYGGFDSDFYYLTADAANGNLKDPVLRESVAISSDELTEWIKNIPALKQVLIFDACHSGQFAEDFLTKRELRNASEIKALERMKDRTGMYILSGSAADAVSYEASVYGQGLLTYALLFGMKGASLREGKFVDVVQLFQFTADKVPVLAEDIGGIQKPEIRLPLGGESFDIGLLESEDREQIKLPNPKPLYIQSSFQNHTTFDDNLELSDLLDEELKNLQESESSIVFVDVSKFNGAFSIRGQYRQKGKKIQLQANLLQDGRVVKTYNVKGITAKQVIEKLIESGLDNGTLRTPKTM